MLIADMTSFAESTCVPKARRFKQRLALQHHEDDVPARLLRGI